MREDQRHDLMRAAWAAVVAGRMSEDAAQALAEAVEAERAAAAAPVAVASSKPRGAFPRRAKRYPRPDRLASIHRRRNLAASGMIPARLATHFTQSEAAALAVVAVEVMRRGRCVLPLDQIAALAGVGRTTVQNALRAARRLGLVHVTERRFSESLSAPNIVEVVDPAWRDWIAKRGRVQKSNNHVEPNKKNTGIGVPELGITVKTGIQHRAAPGGSGRSMGKLAPLSPNSRSRAQCHRKTT